MRRHEAELEKKAETALPGPLQPLRSRSKHQGLRELLAKLEKG
jgi:hypothetical protein